MDDQEEKLLKIVKCFTELMNNSKQWSCQDLSEDAVIDWFGRSVCGPSAILRFIKTRLTNYNLKVMRVKRIAPIKHRFINYKKTKKTIKPPAEEDKQGDPDVCHTPDNPIVPDFKELLKAPKRKGSVQCTYNEDWQFVEIKGNLEYMQDYSSAVSPEVRKQVKRIVLGYTDVIHFILYEGNSICKKQLFRI